MPMPQFVGWNQAQQQSDANAAQTAQMLTNMAIRQQAERRAQEEHPLEIELKRAAIRKSQADAEMMAAKQQFYSPQNTQQYMEPGPAQAPVTPNDDEGNPNPPVAGKPQMNFDRFLQDAATRGIVNPETYATHKAGIETRNLQIQTALQSKREEILGKIEAARLRGEDQRAIAQMQIDGRKEMVALAQSLKQEPPVQTHVDANGTLWERKRGGQWEEAKGPDGESIKSAQGPETKRLAKLKGDLPQARLRTDSMVQNMDRLVDALNELHDDKGLSRITGTIAGRTPNITNTATGAQAKLDSIHAQFFVSALQAMREASKTGGAVGNVSDREGDKLERVIVGLSQSQGTPDFKRKLKQATEQIKLSKTLIQRAFQEQYGDMDTGAPAAPTAAPKVMKFDAQGNLIPEAQ